MFGKKDEPEGEETVFNAKDKSHKTRPGSRGGLVEPGVISEIAGDDVREDALPKYAEPPPQEEFKPMASVGQPTVGVKILNGLKINRPDGEFFIVVTVDGPRKAYLAPVGSIEYNMKAVQQVDVSKLAEVYDWKAEIEQMIPDRETVRRNILEAFWRAGAIDRASVKSASVKAKMWQNAFPYSLPED